MSVGLEREPASYTSIKSKAQADQHYKIVQQERKRNSIVLFLELLRSEGYTQSVIQIEQETNISLDQYAVCDNIDIINIIADFEEYYQFKFNKPVKIVKKLAQTQQKIQAPRQANALDRIIKKNYVIDTIDANLQNKSQGITTPKQRPDSKTSAAKLPVNKTPKPINKDVLTKSQSDVQFEISGMHIEKDDIKKVKFVDKQVIEEESEKFRPILQPPPPNFPSELLSFYYIIQREILSEHPIGGFESVVGLDNAKQTLKESVIFPKKYPELFQGILKPWKGCLMFSSPGNGKSHLARSLAAECGCVFFNVSAASLLSKYYGESEKLVRCLFLIARQYESAVIFIDELDCLMTSRGDSSEHEAGRRLKTQLLVEIDGLTSFDQNTFVLAATNLPWSIDSAMLRRLEKRVFVPNLDLQGRIQLIKKQIGDRVLQESVIEKLAEETNNWSGSDICCVCKEAAMVKLRSAVNKLESGDHGQLNLTVSILEIEQAIKIVHPSYDNEIQKKYQQWADQFGSV
ncbi:Katanin p60 ATPase [Spironucleus salmonicida]|uniref:Katanin p60 ATPase n=1 Tax=Spironucleus salmonicida TaxID=348837 RepID=V6LVA9_9EUKA|nr:Katanin p60 ATPase [Spironucleus salmonicida]|eukprot:EST48530.1 P60 katanin [Spironucleus salmonicida]